VAVNGRKANFKGLGWEFCSVVEGTIPRQVMKLLRVVGLLFETRMCSYLHECVMSVASCTCLIVIRASLTQLHAFAFCVEIFLLGESCI
jgi:hypothetical protein